MNRLYNTKNWRPVEIAVYYGVDHRLVNQWLTDYKIPRKGSQYSAKLRISRSGEAFARPAPRQPMYEDL